MASELSRLNLKEIEVLLDGLRSGSLRQPFTELALMQVFGSQFGPRVFSELKRLEDQGFSDKQISLVFEELSNDRKARGESLLDRVSLVWTGPETDGTLNRDTKIVVRELFAKAQSSVLVAGFAVYQGREVFSSLAERMKENPALDVRFFLNIHRAQGDTSVPDQLVRQFSEKFKKRDWPGDLFPRVFYDPRSIELDRKKASVLHAKVIIVDGRHSFVSSANFTEAAQERNIEVGVLIDSPEFAGQLAGHFDALQSAGALLPVPGIRAGRA